MLRTSGNNCFGKSLWPKMIRGASEWIFHPRHSSMHGFWCRKNHLNCLQCHARKGSRCLLRKKIVPNMNSPKRQSVPTLHKNEFLTVVKLTLLFIGGTHKTRRMQASKHAIRRESQGFKIPKLNACDCWMMWYFWKRIRLCILTLFFKRHCSTITSIWNRAWNALQSNKHTRSS